MKSRLLEGRLRTRTWAVRCALLAGLLFVAGCGDTKVVTQTVDRPVSPASEPPAPPPPVENAPAGVGGTIEIQTDSGTDLNVTLVKVLDPVQGEPDFDTPDRGTRYVGVVLSIMNAGQAPYDDAPSNGAAMIDDSDGQHDAELLAGGPCKLVATVVISPGDQRRVCLGFQVPNGRQPRLFQFGPNSGIGGAVAEWALQ